MLAKRKGEHTVQEPKLNTASLDLRPLYYFVQVAELGSFSRAAAALSMGQPIVSRFIRRLEDELQVQLFHRHGRGVQLTEAGERLLEHSRAILRNLSQARTEITALGGVPVGSVSVAMPPLFGHVLAVDLLRRLRADYPLVTIHIREGYATDTIEWLSSGAGAAAAGDVVVAALRKIVRVLLEDQLAAVPFEGREVGVRRIHQVGDFQHAVTEFVRQIAERVVARIARYEITDPAVAVIPLAALLGRFRQRRLRGLWPLDPWQHAIGLVLMTPVVARIEPYPIGERKWNG